MNARLLVLTLSPLVLSVTSWIGLYRTKRLRSIPAAAVIALSILTLNSMLAIGTFLYYGFHSSAPSLPGHNPEFRNYLLLLFVAPVGLFIGLLAPTRETPKWMFWVLLLSPLPLAFLGFVAVWAF